MEGIKIILWSVICRGMVGHTGRDGGRTEGDMEIVIRFGMYNICNGRNRGLESALRVMGWANLDL